MTRKVIAILLALAMVFALALTACGGEETDETEAADSSAADEGEDTTASTEETDAETIDWYCCWDMSNYPDFDSEVGPYINQYFQDNMGISVNYHFFGSADYATKFNAALTSGTDIDLMYMFSNLTGFYVWYERNALEPLDDLLDEYGTELKADMPDYAFKATTIDGSIYAMPTIKDLATDIGFLYNETLIEEIGLTDEFNSVDFLLAKDYNDFFYDAQAARNELHADWADQAIMPNYTTEWAYYKADKFVDGVFTMIPGLKCFEDKTAADVFSLYETTEYSDMIALIKQWTDDNITPYDPDNYDTDNNYWKEGHEIGQFEWGLMVAETNQYEEYGWYQGLVHPTYAFTYTLQMHDRMHAISALTTDSKKVAAMKVYNALCEDPQMATSIRFGVEGIHWQKVQDANGNDRAEFDFEGGKNADPTSRSYYFWYMAEVGNLYRIYLPTTQPDDFLDIMSDLNSNAAASENMGFLLATTNIQNEIAAVANCISEYNTDMLKGLVDDYASRIDAFNEALASNGIQTIVDEAQSQLDTWRAAEGL